MPKTFNVIWVHIVFSTKERVPYLNWHIRGSVCEWIKNEAIGQDIYVDIVNGHNDHLHVLLKLKPTQNVAEVVGWIKGGSSKWLNDHFSWEKRFAWQEGYGVFSVSPKDVIKVRKYIYEQESHHKDKTYSYEINELIKKN